MFVVLTIIRLMNEIEKPKSVYNSAMSLQSWEYLQQFEKQKNLDLDGLIQVYREHWRDESWQEVLCLMARMLDAKFTGKILECLIGEDGEAEGFSNLFLAAQCLDEVKNRNDIADVAGRLCAEVKELTKYGNITASTSQEYQKPVYQIRRQAVAVVAATWKDDPETLPWLKERARTDDNLDVRRAAVQKLARGWKDDPETLPILKERARTDDDSDVRSAAVQELVWVWKDEPGIFELLCDIAINDPFDRKYYFQHSHRRVALAAIIELYADRPQTLELVRDRAQNDGDQQLREFAQQKLAELEG